MTSNRFENLLAKYGHDYVTLLPHGWRTRHVEDAMKRLQDAQQFMQEMRVYEYGPTPLVLYNNSQGAF